MRTVWGYVKSLPGTGQLITVAPSDCSSSKKAERVNESCRGAMLDNIHPIGQLVLVEKRVPHDEIEMNSAVSNGLV